MSTPKSKLYCQVCDVDLLQVGEWRTVFCPAENLELFFCPGCAGEVLARLAGRGIRLLAANLAVGVYEFKQET